MEEFTSFPVEKINPETNIPGTLYFYIAGKFIKYLHANDKLPKEKYNYLVERKFKYLFVESKDFEKFQQWSKSNKTDTEINFEKFFGKNVLSQTKAATIEGSPQTIEKKQEELEKEFLDFVTREVTDKTTQSLIDKTNTFVKEMIKTDVASSYFEKLLKYEKRTANHSLNVANLSAYLALNLGFSKDTDLEKIYMGALLHDYGKTKINPQSLGDKGSNKYKLAMKKHSMVGKTNLILEDTVHEDALRIVGEHHERFDGKGYPKGLRGAQISPYSKIVSIANAFDKLVEKNESEIDIAQRTAITTLQKDHSRHFDPKVLARCIRAMNQIMK